MNLGRCPVINNCYLFIKCVNNHIAWVRKKFSQQFKLGFAIKLGHFFVKRLKIKLLFPRGFLIF